MYFYCTYSIKTKILPVLGSGYFLKIVKIDSQQEKPIGSNRGNHFPQNTQKMSIHKNKLRQKFLAQTVVLAAIV